MLRTRLAPAAITPVSIRQVVSAFFSSLTKNEFVLQKHLVKYLNAKEVCTYTSLMRASYACFLNLQTKTKKTIIMPRYLCPSFIHGALASHCKIVYCDQDPKTFSYDLKKLRKIKTDGVFALLCPNLFGLCNPMGELQAYCRSEKIAFIETADYTLGADYDGKKLGSYGDYTILNFQEGKAIPVGGAAVVSRKNKYIEQLDSTRKPTATNLIVMAAYAVCSHPIFYNLLISILDILQIDRKKLSMEDTIRSTTNELDFSFSETELKRLSTFQSILGTKILGKIEKQRVIRWRNVQKLKALVSSIPFITEITKNTHMTKHHYLRYPVLVKPEMRDHVIQVLLQHGIEASSMYNEHGTSIEKRLFPGSHMIAERILTLPCHPYMSAKDFDAISQGLSSIMGKK